jgi:hypothetical protein
MSDLKNILDALDDSNPTHWTDDGAPRLEVVQSLSRDPAITRADLALYGRVRDLTPKPIPLTHEAAAIAADNAEAAALAARERVAAQKVTVRIARKALADAVLIWQGSQPKRDVADLVRENAAAEIERKMAVIRGEIEPEEVQAIAPASHLDAVLQSGRGGGQNSVNRGWRRQPGRLPSQRS